MFEDSSSPSSFVWEPRHESEYGPAEAITIGGTVHLLTEGAKLKHVVMTESWFGPSVPVFVAKVTEHGNLEMIPERMVGTGLPMFTPEELEELRILFTKVSEEILKHLNIYSNEAFAAYITRSFGR